MRALESFASADLPGGEIAWKTGPRPGAAVMVRGKLYTFVSFNWDASVTLRPLGYWRIWRRWIGWQCADLLDWIAAGRRTT